MARALAVGFVAAMTVGLGVPGCLVEERCYLDADCPGDEICSAAGVCVFECAADGDCDNVFGTEFICVDRRCLRAPACTVCGFPHAEHSCVHGDCQLVSCHVGYYDEDGDPANGCEYRCEDGTFDANGNPDDGCECTPEHGGVEVCNGLDDDCDGEIDEDFSLATNPFHCGGCGQVCPAGEHAVSQCSSGQCRYACEPGYFDRDGRAETGCEAAECTPAVEQCNGRDDDCDCPGDTNGDGIVCGPDDEGVDEGFDRTTVDACGPYCAECAFDHAVARCEDGVCWVGGCEPGYVDLDKKSGNGCEYACVPAGEETCNGADDDCDGLIDEGDICACPADMVAVGNAYCIDRYEASRPDATVTSQGTDGAIAVSRPGVLPWMVSMMTSSDLRAFQDACVAAGKHLCSKDEWFAACSGPDNLPFVYGDTFDPETCNCVDTFCDDYCTVQGIASCSTSENCGYAYGCFHEVPTGSFPGCTNDYGTFDINGNVWEIVSSDSDARGYEVRGGAFNCASPSQRVSCEFNAGWSELYAGFRCCKDLE
ncbi:MAG: SUMF1/EgtB/PvdO family nonheme iron enzyme [Polyangiaceae bacterium]|nr:SUMF1/EgtB/PvdO family nonheme iron enzyme [Polyangiaceae bacterium]